MHPRSQLHPLPGKHAVLSDPPLHKYFPSPVLPGLLQWKHTAALSPGTVRFVDREDDKPKSQWKTNDDWAWFVGENREPIRLTTKPEPYTLQKALHWLQRQVAPTIKMVQALDKENHTTILKDMIEQAELKDKHKHLLQLEKSTIEERIDTNVPQENDGIF